MSNSFLPAVDAFLRHEDRQRPDFAVCHILVPHRHAAEGFKKALAQRLAGQFLIPPQFFTLPQLSIDASPTPSGRMLAELHELLSHSRLAPEHSLWPAAQELADLFEELDAENLGLDALAGMGNRLLDLESEVVRQLWQVARSSGLSSQAGSYVQALRSLSLPADAPIYSLGLVALSSPERAFLQRHSVIDLPVPPRHGERQQLLQLAWQDESAALLERAGQASTTFAVDPIDGALQLIAADSLESMAQAAEAQLVAWLTEGRRDIAILAMDRLLARRLRALAERRGILMRDETGWTLSTAAASHVVECWIRINERLDSHRDLIDLLKSPLILPDLAELRSQALYELENAWRRHGSPASLKAQWQFARHWQLTAAEAILQRLLVAQGERPGLKASLSRWTAWLNLSLQALGVAAALRADPIGQHLLTLLEDLQRDMAPIPTRLDYGDWRHWLLMQIEAASFTDDSVDSPLRLTHPSAARLRDWEAVLVLGVDAKHLPGTASTGLFNDRVRRQLGLPDQTQREAQLQAALIDIFARSDAIALLWQAQEGAEPQALSPWLISLDSFQRLAWGQGLTTRSAPSMAHIDSATPAPAAPSADHLPERLSVSAWQSLVTCPYQFHARYLLGLEQPDAVPEELDKTDYGSLIHAILARFHQHHPQLAPTPREALLNELQALSSEIFAADGSGRYSDELWQLRWLKNLPAYLDWALAWEADGHHFQAAEVKLAKRVTLPGTACELHGRADRIDQGPAGPVVLDYKTQSESVLRRKVQSQGEDVQLATYAWLADAAQAAFVGIDQTPVKTHAGKDDTAAALAEAERIATTLTALAAGASLPAQGTPQACQWCEMRGLCRHEHDSA